MNRRTILSGTGVAFLIPFIGCLDRSSNDGNDSNIGTDNDSKKENNTDDQSTEGDEYAYKESRQDPIFIENFTENEMLVEVVVEQKSTGEILIENMYEVPQKTGLEIPDIADAGDDYGITAEYDEMIEEYDWTVLTCAHEDGPEVGGETALGIEITEGDLQIFHTGCDEAGAGEHSKLSHHPHENYAVDNEYQ